MDSSNKVVPISNIVKPSIKDYAKAYKLQVIWLVIFFFLQLFLFAMGIVEYYELMRTFKRPHSIASLFGYAFGMVVQVDCGLLIMFPAFRWTFGHLRQTRLARVIPFDSIVSFHVILGFTVGAMAIGHFTSFIIHFYRNTLMPSNIAKNRTMYRYMFEAGMIGVDWYGLANITGLCQIFTLMTIIIFALPPMRKLSWELYYWTHKLRLLFWAMLILHDKNFWKFLVIPMAVYFVEKCHKWFGIFRWSLQCRIVQVNLMPGYVVNLCVKRPKAFVYWPGDYVFVKIPRLGILSWHPFTLTSSPQQTDLLTFHIKVSGGWTGWLYKKYLREFNKSSSKNGSVISLQVDGRPIGQPGNTTVKSLINLNGFIILDGPYHSSTSSIFNSEHAILIAGGIGMTPLMSILQTALDEFKNSRPNLQKSSEEFGGKKENKLCLKKVDFIWAIREEDKIEWLRELLGKWKTVQLSLAPNEEMFMECHIHITGAKSVRQVEDISEKYRDIEATIHLGRPEWDKVFGKLAQKRLSSSRVIFCGPQGMESQVRGFSARYNFECSFENFY